MIQNGVLTDAMEVCLSSFRPTKVDNIFFAPQCL